MIILYGGFALGASFLCSILEAVLLSTSQGFVGVLEQKGSRAAPLWTRFKADPERPLTAILTLNTIAHTVGALGVGIEVEKGNPGQYGMIIASALLTLGILLLSEILPKTIGTLYWKSLSKPAAFILQMLIILLIWIVIPIELIRKLFPTPSQEKISREELAALAEIGEDEGTIEEDEEKVITNLLRLREISVVEVMTPRVVMTTISADYTVSQIMEDLPIMTHGRMPVLGESIDDVRGIVLRSDILGCAAVDDHDMKVVEIMRDVAFCDESDSVDAVLDILLEKREQILIVRDQFGGTLGLITMEDIIETLLGVEIVDEADIEAIEEGTAAEDMREYAKEKFAENGDDHPAPH
jgi:CBS domain containing-hemolysin-like protein